MKNMFNKSKYFVLLVLALVSITSFAGCNTGSEVPSSDLLPEKSNTYESSENISSVSQDGFLSEEEARHYAEMVAAASEMYNAAKTYYVGIKTSYINEDNKPSSLSAYTLPKAGASESERLEYANKATLKEAMIWYGNWEKLSEYVTNGEFGVVQETSIGDRYDNIRWCSDELVEHPIKIINEDFLIEKLA